jgi:hypothetical protein
MAWRVATSLDILLGQINARFPNRDRQSDGSIGDPAHENRDSDHNPWYGPGIVTARDYDHDPASGMDCDELTDQLAAGRDPRIKYMIFNRWILDSRPQFSPWRWVRYTGRSPHTTHLHLSVMAHPSCDSATPWALPMLGTWAPPPPPDGGPSGRPTVRLGSVGTDVLHLQRRLKARFPLYAGRLVTDGVFGARTQAAVQEFQRRSGLAVDGVVGASTWTALGF